MTVAIINYGLGNLRSVANAIAHVGGHPVIVDHPDALKSARHIILPGVGAFGDGMAHLNDRGWSEALREQALVHKKPFLGICLGMQLLAEAGLEHGTHQGLGLISGTVRRIVTSDTQVRIPHIGWNTVTARPGRRMYAELTEPQDYYFVHSYILDTPYQACISATCLHGENFVASLEHNNIWGTQFHPEKSQKPGLQILQNFVRQG